MNRPRYYGYADVGRYGLGHGLLAWARCVVWCHDHDAEVLAPRWLRLRIGPLLRRERDKRFYAKLFVRGEQLGAFQRTWLLLTRPRRNVVDLAPQEWASLPDGTVLVFKNRVKGNEATHFHEIVGRQQLVSARLKAMTRTRFHPRQLGHPHVALHVRGGDFVQPSSVATLQLGQANHRLPVSWFADMVTGVRRRLGVELPAVVYSDCPDDELAALLKLPQVSRSRYFESVTDMLAMREATVQISSGSGFSRLGAYLGDVPRICFPGQRHVRVLRSSPEGVPDREPEALLADDLPDGFIAHIHERVSQFPFNDKV
jgi:hypothetical protein